MKVQKGRFKREGSKGKVQKGRFKRKVQKKSSKGGIKRRKISFAYLNTLVPFLIKIKKILLFLYNGFLLFRAFSHPREYDNRR
jgi:hypothetical protein